MLLQSRKIEKLFYIKITKTLNLLCKAFYEFYRDFDYSQKKTYEMKFSIYKIKNKY